MQQDLSICYQAMIFTRLPDNTLKIADDNCIISAKNELTIRKDRDMCGKQLPLDFLNSRDQEEIDRE